MGTAIERRQFRRAEIDVPVEIQTVAGEGEPAAVVTGQVKNISLAGVYGYTKAPCPLKPGEQIHCTITIPPEQTRLFPFARLVGKGWVRRVEPVKSGRRAEDHRTDGELLGFAVAFAPDVTALGTITK